MCVKCCPGEGGHGIQRVKSESEHFAHMEPVLKIRMYLNTSLVFTALGSVMPFALNADGLFYQGDSQQLLPVEYLLN